MIVVSDASPFIALIGIGQIDLLPQLFHTVFVPPAIIVELTRPDRSPAVSAFIEERPGWLIEQVPARIEAIPKLHSGETEAISLAREMNADLLLIDESLGRRSAIQRKLNIAGTIGVLEMAAKRNLVGLDVAFAKLRETSFWVSAEFLERRLKEFASAAEGEKGR
ncbi:MAG: DUF3368 domain-containing protein [Candidatus Hydrogenedentes bacterium]|nr:DUF3368 domain-containing protein [Candidatus Hydrogenedentota bacterium]